MMIVRRSHRILFSGLMVLVGLFAFAQSSIDAELKANQEDNPTPFDLPSQHSNLDRQAVVIYSSDFESDDGGWVSGGFGDWEWGTFVAGVGSGCDSAGQPEPAAAYSGTQCWATNLDGCYTNAGATSTMSQTFDFSALTGTIELSFQTWYHVFGNFDYIEIFVNGTQVWLHDSSNPTADWGEVIVDLSSYAGNASVDIEFSLYATSVVNRSGWYVDDIQIAAEGGQPPVEIPTLGQTGMAIFALLLCGVAVAIMMRKRVS